MQARAFRDFGAGLQREQGGSGLREVPPKGGEGGLVSGGADDGAAGDDDGSLTLVDTSVAQQVREGAQSWAADEALRRCKAEKTRADEMEAMRVQLSNLMEAVSTLSAQTAAAAGSGAEESKTDTTSATEPSMKADKSERVEASGLESVEKARELAGG